MYLTRNEFAGIEYDFLHDACYLIGLVHEGFKSLYMDKDGGLCLNFAGHLTEDEVKGVLFELHPFGKYEAAPIGPSAEPVKYGIDYDYDGGNTYVYSREGYDYRKTYEELGA